MTDTMTSQNIYLSSWDTLYKTSIVKYDITVQSDASNMLVQ
jgi:hypothetical protein